MPRKITLSFEDGTSHVYDNVPDDVTPDAVHARAQKEFGAKRVVNIDGGKAPKKELQAPAWTGIPEAGLSMLAGLPGQIAGGIMGFGSVTSDLLKGQSPNWDQAGQIVKDIQESNFGLGAYQGTTEQGKKATQKLGELMAMPGEAAGDYIGAPIGKLLGNESLGHLSARLPVDAALNFLPLHLGVVAPLKGLNKLAEVSGERVAAKKAAPKDFNKIVEEEVPSIETTYNQLDLFPSTLEQGPGQGLSPQAIAELRAKGTQQTDLFASDTANRDVGGAYGETIPEPILSAQRTHDFLSRAKQDEIDATPYGDRPAQYGMTDTGGRVDENGIPIRADLSMEAQNLQDPLQRNLWGDELPGRSQDGSIGMTQALDKMPPGVAREQALAQLSGIPEKPLVDKVNTVLNEGMGGLSHTQRGAIDLKTLSEGFEKIKELSGGVKLRAFAEGDGQLNVVATDANGKYIGGTRMSPENYRNPKPEDFMSSLGTDSSKRGLATEMYKFVSELGNDIVPAKSQTPDGKAMWEGFERRGLAVEGKIPAKGSPRNLAEPNSWAGDTSTEGFKGMSRGQRGAIDFFKSKKPMPDAEDLTLKAPPPGMSLEQAKATNTLADKAAAVGINQYSRVTSPEQVLAAGSQGAAMPSYTGVRNTVISGIEGMVRRYPQNKLLNFTRNVFQEARNTAEIWSKEYLTGKNGLNNHLNNLSTGEKNDLVGLLLALDKAQKPLTDAVMDRAGFSTEQRAAATRLREALDHLYAEKTKALGEQGFDAHMYRQGYVPANFGGAYKSIVGHYTKDGSWVTTGIAQADTLYGLKKAEAWYKKQDGSVEVIRAGTSKLGTGRTGLKASSGVGRSNDAWANLISALAKVDPKFAEVKAQADQKGIDATASLYNYQVHELRKKGVTGSFGDRPWLDRDTNTRQFIQGVVEYLEDGYRYTAYQKPIVEVSKLLTNPELRKDQPSASQYVERYVEHIKGQSLNAVGAGLNQAVDMISASVGLGHSKISKVAHEISHYSALQMMGVGNLGFLGMQLTQMFSGGLPEAMSLASQHGIEPRQVPRSLQNTLSFLQNMGLEYLGKDGAKVEPHMKEAFNWANQVGMFTFSESELAHQVLQSQLRKKSDKILDSTIRYGELATRPVVFMWYADMMHNAGYTGQEALLKAQTATDYAMVNYHPDERPMLYQSLGVVGSLMGALSTYKHNFGTQIVTRGVTPVIQAVGGKGLREPAALGTFIALGAAMYGIGGFPGYDEADSIVNKASGKTIRQWVLDNPEKPSIAMDGWLSAATEMDFQSRLSMSSLFPDSVGGMFPHISNVANITMKGIEAAMNPDKGSIQDFAMAAAPKSIANVAETKLWDEGNVRSRKTGENKYATPRSPEEEMVRAITGIRPFRESLEDKATYASRVTKASRQDKLKAAQARFDRAWLLNDGPGMDRAAGDYEKHSGDITTLFNSDRLATVSAEAQKSEKERRAGTPSNVNTLKTYETFMGNK